MSYQKRHNAHTYYAMHVKNSIQQFVFIYCSNIEQYTTLTSNQPKCYISPSPTPSTVLKNFLGYGFRCSKYLAPFALILVMLVMISNVLSLAVVFSNNVEKKQILCMYTFAKMVWRTNKGQSIFFGKALPRSTLFFLSFHAVHANLRKSRVPRAYVRLFRSTKLSFHSNS